MKWLDLWKGVKSAVSSVWSTVADNPQNFAAFLAFLQGRSPTPQPQPSTAAKVISDLMPVALIGGVIVVIVLLVRRRK